MQPATAGKGGSFGRGKDLDISSLKIVFEPVSGSPCTSFRTSETVSSLEILEDPWRFKEHGSRARRTRRYIWRKSPTWVRACFSCCAFVVSGELPQQYLLPCVHRPLCHIAPPCHQHFHQPEVATGP